MEGFLNFLDTLKYLAAIVFGILAGGFLLRANSDNNGQGCSIVFIIILIAIFIFLASIVPGWVIFLIGLLLLIFKGSL